MNHVFPKLLRILAPLCLSIDEPGGGGAGGGGGTPPPAGGAGAGGGTGGGAGGGTTPPPVVATDFRSFIGEDGSLKPGWGKAFEAPEGFEKKFTNLKPLLGSFASLERMQFNGNKVAIPGENATPEEWETFHSKIRGVAKEDEYAVTVPDEMKGIALDENAIKEFKGLMFKAGAPAKVVQAAAEYYFKTIGKQIAAENQKREQSHTDAIQALEKDWGGKDSVTFKENKALAEKGAAAAKLTPEVLQSTPELSNNPHFIRAMAEVGRMIGEKGAANLRGGATGDMGANVQAQIDAFVKNSNSDYYSKDNTKRAAAVKKVEDLYKQLHPVEKG